MPARSNAFQRLIFAIEQTLAPTGVVVTESKILIDRDGASREVDVLIEGGVSAHPVRIAIECRDRRRPADVTWIDELHGKYRDLPVNKVVAVSRTGFTAAALRKAVALGISTLTLPAASRFDWAAAVRRVARVDITSTEYVAVDAELVWPEPHRTSPPDVGGNPLDLHITNSHHPNPFTIRDLAYGNVNRPEIQAQLEIAARSNPEGLVELVLHDPGKVMHAGGAIPIASAIVGLRRLERVVSVPLSHAYYGESAVAYGEGELDGMHIRVVKTQHAGSESASTTQIIVQAPPHVHLIFPPPTADDGGGLECGEPGQGKSA